MNNKYFILILIVIFSVSGIMSFLSDSTSESIVKQILESHIDEIVVDENYTNFEELSQKMTGLNFKIKSVDFKELQKSRMIGARYFNFDERIGAQIKFRDEEQKVISLYEFEVEDSCEDLESIIEVNDQRYKIKLEAHENLCFLLVRSLPKE